MRVFRYIFAWLLILLVFVTLAGYFYVQTQGRQLVERQLSKFFRQPVSMQDIRYLMPFGLRIKGLTVRNVISAGDIHLQLSMPLILSDRLVIGQLNIKDGKFYFVRHGASQIEFGGVYLSVQEDRLQKDAPRRPGRRVQGVTIERLTIVDSRIEILDLTAEQTRQYKFHDLDLKASHVTYPLKDERLRFDLTAVAGGAVPGQFQGQWVADGWLNWPARVMEAQMAFISPEEDFDMTARAEGRDNQLNVNGSFRMTPEKGPKVGETLNGAKENGLPEIFLGVLQKSGAELEMKFSFQTKMDEFHLGVIDYEGDLTLKGPKGKGMELDKLNLLKFFKEQQEKIQQPKSTGEQMPGKNPDQPGNAEPDSKNLPE